jgi:hypothetical protein
MHAATLKKIWRVPHLMRLLEASCTPPQLVVSALTGLVQDSVVKKRNEVIEAELGAPEVLQAR